MGFLVVVKHIIKVAWPTVMLIYPLYASIRAIESPSELDDQQWLTYWVLYSLITLFELTFYKILAWIPIWPYVKLVLLFWLVLPMFNGAAYIYENYVRKFVVAKEQPSSPELPKGKKQVYRMISPTARAGVERYIAIHGYDSLERVIKEAEKEEEKQEGSPAGADH